MIYLYGIFKLLLQGSSSHQAGSQGQGRPGSCAIANTTEVFCGSQECLEKKMNSSRGEDGL